MKKTSLLTILIAFMAMSTFAQTPAQAPTQAPASGPRTMPTPEERAQRQTDRMKTDLNLTPEQYQKVLAINKDFITQNEALRAANKGQMSEESKAKFQELRKTKDDKTIAVLTAEQRTKYQSGPKPRGNVNNMRPTPATTPATAPAAK